MIRMFQYIDNDLDSTSAMSIVLDLGNSQNVSNLSGISTTMFKTVEMLFQVQERQTEIQFL